MYHNEPHNFELPDDIGEVTHAAIVKNGDKYSLVLDVKLREDREVGGNGAPLRLHLTNGVNHIYIPLEMYDATSAKGKK